MKKISIVTSCFNEEDNISLLYKKLKDIIEKLNSRYNFEIIFDKLIKIRKEWQRQNILIDM